MTCARLQDAPEIQATAQRLVAAYGQPEALAWVRAFETTERDAERFTYWAALRLAVEALPPPTT